MPEMTASEAARILSRLGASKGGEARKNALSPARKLEISLSGVRAQWGEKAYQKALKRLKSEKALELAKSGKNRQAKGSLKETKAEGR